MSQIRRKSISSKPFLSIVIPVFNEQSRLYHLNEIVDFVKAKKYKSEIVVVNDGSTDDTLAILKSLKKTLGFKLISYKENRGKGYAIKTGMLNSSGKIKLFTDIDLSTPITELDKFVPLIDRYDVVIGTRKGAGSRVIKHQSVMRENLGKSFTFLSQKWLGLNVSDFTCGFKLFTKSAADNIFSLTQIDRWGFDSEVLFIATQKKWSIVEVPVTWNNDPHTKVKFPQDIINSLTDLLAIRLNSLLGKYSAA